MLSATYKWTTGIFAIFSTGLLISVDSAKYVEAAYVAPPPPTFARRDITDRHGHVIATSQLAYDLWLIPEDFWSISPANPRSKHREPVEALPDTERRSRLLDILGNSPQLRSIVEGRLDAQGKSRPRPMILAWGITPEMASKINASGLSGLKLLPRTIRHYPQGGLFSHTLGFVSRADSMNGQEGLELAENHTLVGTTDNNRNAGAPLQTTLDPELQGITVQALINGVTKHGAISGAAVVVEANTGEIRAMVSSPVFDANDDASFRNPFQPERILNQARTSFPMGSLLTPLLAAHAIETGRMQASTRIAIGKSLKLGKTRIVDVSTSDSLTLSEIVTRSSNIGQAKLALALPLPELRDITRNLGIGEPLQIRGIPGSVDYTSVDWSEWTPAMHAQPGLHINVNLLQALRAYLPLANGGKLARLRLLEEERTKEPVKVLSEHSIAAMRDILSAAAGPTGTAPLAQLPGVLVAGKTGTIVATSGQPVAVFIGMAPAEKPRWLIGVLLHFPLQQPKLAGSTAAPVFASIMGKVIKSEEEAS